MPNIAMLIKNYTKTYITLTARPNKTSCTQNNNQLQSSQQNLQSIYQLNITLKINTQTKTKKNTDYDLG